MPDGAAAATRPTAAVGVLIVPADPTKPYCTRRLSASADMHTCMKTHLVRAWYGVEIDAWFSLTASIPQHHRRGADCSPAASCASSSCTLVIRIVKNVVPSRDTSPPEPKDKGSEHCSTQHTSKHDTNRLSSASRGCFAAATTTVIVQSPWSYRTSGRWSCS